jgi:membrane associated rhomboid family serine protease
MKIYFNAPIILAFSGLCLILVLLDTFHLPLMSRFFSVPGTYAPFQWNNPVMYFRLFSHSMGHAHWDHLLGNMTFLLLLGPMLEEKYGSRSLLIMMMITAGTTGILNMLLFPTGLLGASGIVFSFILLSSFANMRSGGIPLSFVVVTIFFLGKEVVSIFEHNQVSEFAHLCGGTLGAIFGFTKSS